MKKNLWKLALVLGTAFTAQPVLAEQSNQASEESGDIIVSARRVDERLQDVPLAISAIGERALERHSITEIRQLGSLSPSLNIKEHSNNPQGMLISLRGQTQAGVMLTTDSSVGVYVDGISVPRSNGLRSALVDIARVEVLRGPQGTLYGRNTTGGALSIVTNNPTDRLEGSVRITAGNFQLANAVGILNVPLGENLAARFVAQKGTRDGYGRDGVGREASDDDSLYLRGKLRASLGRVVATISVDHSRLSQGPGTAFITGVNPGYSLAVGQIAAELGLPMLPSTSPAFLIGQPATPEALAAAHAVLAGYVGGRGGSPYNNDETTPGFAYFKGTSVGVDLEWELNDELSVRSLTGYRHTLRSNRVGADMTPFEIFITDFLSKADFFSQELQLIGNFDRLSFVAGGYYSFEDGFESTRIKNVPLLLANSFSAFDGDVRNKNLSVFAQFNYELTDQLTFTGGLRYSTEKKRLISYNNNLAGCAIPTVLLDQPGVCQATLNKKDSDPSWLASLSYKIAPDVMVYAKTARGFRAGGHNIRGSRTVESFAAFDPETIDEYELGFKSFVFNKMIQLNLAAYYDKYKDVQRTITLLIPGAGTTTLVSNAAKSTIKGVDLEATLRPARGLEISAVVGYLDAKYDRFVDATGDRTNEDWPASKWTFAFSGRYAVPVSLGELAFQVDYQGQSAQNLYPGGARPAETTQKAYGLLNGRISLAVGDQYEIAVFGRNLTNKVYLTGAQAFDKSVGYNFGFVGAPRTYGAELKFNF